MENFQKVIGLAFPEFAGSRYTLLTTGWDCVAVDVDDRWIFKFPRHLSAEQALRTEVSLLEVLRPFLTLPVPAPELHPGHPIFSRHLKLKGDHLLAEQYEALPDGDRQRLAEDLALFYAELHGIDAAAVHGAGARPIKPWLSPEEIADSGFGSLHQEFIYSNWIAPDLTARIVTEYEIRTGRSLDRTRIHLLSGVLRLSELAEYADDPHHAPAMTNNVRSWAG